MLFEIAPSDPLTFASVAAGLLTIATGASLVPALRAMRVDPVSVLRVD
jgi:putative ABC transport system permease protein